MCYVRPDFLLHGEESTERREKLGGVDPPGTLYRGLAGLWNGTNRSGGLGGPSLDRGAPVLYARCGFGGAPFKTLHRLTIRSLILSFIIFFYCSFDGGWFESESCCEHLPGLGWQLCSWFASFITTCMLSRKRGWVLDCRKNIFF